MTLIRTVIAGALGVLLGSTADAQTYDPATVCPANWSPLQRSDPAYADADAFARTLAERGVIVSCIAPSKMVGTFEGQKGAALFRTSVGDFEFLVLPASQTFDALEIVARRQRGRYLYSFAGQPKPWAA